MILADMPYGAGPLWPVLTCVLWHNHIFWFHIWWEKPMTNHALWVGCPMTMLCLLKLPPRNMELCHLNLVLFYLYRSSISEQWLISLAYGVSATYLILWAFMTPDCSICFGSPLTMFELFVIYIICFCSISMAQCLLLILAMKYNFYWLCFCSLLAKAEPVAMASSSSTGHTGGGCSQWSYNTGYWNHPFYGSYESWHGSHKSGDNDKPGHDAWKDGAWWAESGWKGSWWEKESGDGNPDVDMSGTNTPAAGAVIPVGATPKHKAHPPTASSSAHDEMSLENDIKKCAIDWPPTNDDDEEWEEETEAAIHAKSLFWVPEKLVRLHTGALTPFEVHQLRELITLVRPQGQPGQPGQCWRTLLRQSLWLLALSAP